MSSVSKLSMLSLIVFWSLRFFFFRSISLFFVVFYFSGKYIYCLFVCLFIIQSEHGHLLPLKESCFPLFLFCCSSPLFHWGQIFNRHESAVTLSAYHYWDWPLVLFDLNGILLSPTSTSYNNLQLHDIVQTLSNETLQWWDKVDKYYAYNTGK